MARTKQARSRSRSRSNFDVSAVDDQVAVMKASPAAGGVVSRTVNHLCLEQHVSFSKFSP